MTSAMLYWINSCFSWMVEYRLGMKREVLPAPGCGLQILQDCKYTETRKKYRETFKKEGEVWNY